MPAAVLPSFCAKPPTFFCRIAVIAAKSFALSPVGLYATPSALSAFTLPRRAAPICFDDAPRSLPVNDA